MTIEVRVGGVNYGGWKTARVTRAIDQAAGDFAVTLTERYPGQPFEVPIKPGDACQVLVNGDKVLTGYVDDVKVDYDANDHILEITGRSKTADLIDCSAIHKPGQWRGVKLERIAAQLVAPFGLDVVLDLGVDTGDPFDKFAIQQGEKVFAAIERMCRMRGVLASDTTGGDLLITKAGTARSTGAIRFRAVDGRENNVLAGRGTYSMRQRHSDYIVKGQTTGSDTRHGAAVAQPKATVTDANVPRYRPLLVVAEGKADAKAAKDRAEWERARRAGESIKFDYTVQGWVNDTDGALWRPNRLVPIEDDFLRFYGDLLIAETTFEIGPAGTVTRLKLGPVEAFEKRDDKGKKKFPKVRKKSNTSPGSGFWTEINRTL